MTKNTVCMAVAIMMWPVASAPGQTFIYVDVNAAGPIHDGSSWCSAYTTLDDALSVATSGVTILMADGTYRPDPAGLDNPREATFALINGVVIEGGYAGCGAPDPDQRDLTANETILSGDLADNDVPDFTYNEENCYHVLSAYNVDLTTAIDGLTITAGNANGDWWDDQHTGGGILVVTGSLTVMDCTIAWNWGESGGGMAGVLSDLAVIGCDLSANSGAHGGASFNLAGDASFAQCDFDGNHVTHSGGAVHNHLSSPTFTNCTISVNWSQMWGGGMYNAEGSSPVLTSCSLSGNSAAYRGGGMLNTTASNATLTGCTFTGNNASYGGAMYSLDSSSPVLADCVFEVNSAWSSGGAVATGDGDATMTNCAFIGNTAHAGGGVYDYYSRSTLTNCTFDANEVVGGGGGIFNYHGSSPTLIGCRFLASKADHGGGMYCNDADPSLANCTFSGNWASEDGGGMHCVGESPLLTNCAFSGNSADRNGGGMYVRVSAPLLMNCTLLGNSADELGGGVYSSNSDSVLENCLLWSNSDVDGLTEDAQVRSPYSTLAVNYTCVQGWTGLYGGVGNIGSDPQFSDPANGDLRLGPGSPCIDAGDPYFVPEPGETDLDGHVRVLCDRVDMGAYEYGMGDIDCDRNVDLTDFAEWTPCLTGPDGGPIDSGCIPFDFDNDDDVDLSDFAGFMEAYTGHILIASRATMMDS